MTRESASGRDQQIVDFEWIMMHIVE